VPFPVEPNHKFACMALDGPGVNHALPDPFEVAPGVSVLKHAPVEIDEWWSEGLGTWTLERYKNCGLFLVATARSARPEIVDAENVGLEKRLYGLLHALLLHEAGRFYVGQTMTGAREGDRPPNVRQHSRIPECPQHERAELPEIDAGLLTRANSTSVELLRLFGEEDNVLPPLTTGPAARRVQAHGRVRRGFNALLEGLQARYANQRLHHCERALEAVTHPPIGNSRRTFVNRCAVLVGGSPEARGILSDIYDLRSAEEHLNEWEGVLGGRGNPERVALLRAYQAEVLACFAFRHLLENPALLQNFGSDATTSAFWARTNPTPAQAWGRTIDITEAGLRASQRLSD
jgi:hypothetical protein